MRLIQNQLLSALPEEEYLCLLPNLEFVCLALKQIIIAPNQPIEYVYFPTDGIISLVNITINGGTAEAATVVSEGMVGISVLLGANRMLAQAVVQVAGHGVRMRADVFIRVVTPGCQLYRKLLRDRISTDEFNLPNSCLQLPALSRTAMLPLVVNLPRSRRLKLFSPHPRVPRPNAGCTASYCECFCCNAATGRIDSLQSRQNDYLRSRKFRSHHL